MILSDNSLIFSIISLGFLGGFSHCSSMCGPFVLTQIGNNLQKTSLNNFSNFQKLKNLALLPYHLGRITTYFFIGFICCAFSNQIFNLVKFRLFSGVLLILSSLFFINIFFDNKLINFLPHFKKNNKNNAKKGGFFKDFMSFLFKNPIGYKGYLLGIILGFLPCGLLYGAFLIAAAISSPILAGFSMLLFGASTFPGLFITGWIGCAVLQTKNKIINFHQIIKLLALINIIMLLLMAYKLIL